jgi:hypothetical protein
MAGGWPPRGAHLSGTGGESDIRRRPPPGRWPGPGGPSPRRGRWRPVAGAAGACRPGSAPAGADTPPGGPASTAPAPPAPAASEMAATPVSTAHAPTRLRVDHWSRAKANSARSRSVGVATARTRRKAPSASAWAARSGGSSGTTSSRQASPVRAARCAGSGGSVGLGGTGTGPSFWYGRSGQPNRTRCGPCRFPPHLKFALMGWPPGG